MAKIKLTKEVVILSAIVIAYSLQGLPIFDFNAYAARLKDMPEWLIIFRYILSNSLRILLFISGVGILFRKEIFRKLVILSGIFTILTVYWKHPVSVFKQILLLRIKQGIVSAEVLPRIDVLAWKSALVCYAVDILIFSVLIYLLTRPKIKGQFS